MATVPASAQVVVIGAGIVGNSLVHHLARLGWTDIVQIDKGALPNPGGSTGHASNFIFLTDHSREITDLTLDSVEQYQEMGVFTQSGGFEVARTEERMEELRRRMSSAPRRGASRPSWSTPEFVKEKVPFIEKDQFIGAFWQPGVGVVDSLRAGTIMRERALESGALTVVPNVEVIGLDVEDGRDPAGAHQRRRHRGRDRRDRVRRVEPQDRRHGRDLDPADPGRAPDDQRRPVPAAGRRPRARSRSRSSATWTPSATSASTAPTWRSAPTPTARSCTSPRTSPRSSSPSCRRPRCRSRSDDFDPQLEQAYELMPELLGAEGAEIRYAINGLLSLTCDGSPILGESLVKGLWTAAAVWIKEGPGVGRAVAEWMTHGHSEIDVHHSDIARFHPHQMRREHTRLRTTESFIKTYGIIHPAEQYESDRDQRLVADARLAEEARRGVLRDRRLGAAALVRVQRRPARGVRRRRDAARARVGLPLVEPDHQRRAPADARGRRRHRPDRVLHLRHHRAGCARVGAAAPASRSATSRSAR